MGKRTWAPGSPDYLYHVYDDDLITAPFTSAKIKVAKLSGVSATSMDAYSLKKDMDKLRADGVAKGIVKPDRTLGQAPPDNKELMVLKVGKGEHKVLFVGCHHAREWISVEIPYLVAEYLIYNYKDNPTNDKEKRIKHLLTNREITFVPMVNPNGHIYSVTKNRNWRVNRQTYSAPAQLPSTQPPAPALIAPQYDGSPSRSIRYPDNKVFTGVDINRNYATAAWGKETEGGSGTSRDPQDDGNGSQVWCGPDKGSEKETKLIAGLVPGMHATISYHNFWEVVFYPDAALSDAFVVWTGKGMVALIAEGGEGYRFENNSSTNLPNNYMTTGELVDFAYEKCPKRPAYTPEVRPPQPAPNPTWGFSGLPKEEIEPCFLENLKGALALINCAGHNAVAATQSSTFTTGSPPNKCQVVRNCWEIFKGWTP
jgi:Zinc carboxypeptidase